MKKNFLFLLCATLLVATLSITSCNSTESEPEIQKEKDAYELLNKQLSDFDNNFKKSHPMSRGLFSSIVKFMKSDFICFTSTQSPGSFTTGIIGSIGASINAMSVYCVPIDDAIANTEYDSIFNSYLKSSTDTALNAGYYHNQVIRNIAKNNPNALKSDTRTMLNAVRAELIKFGFTISDAEFAQVEIMLKDFQENILVESDEQTFNNLIVANPEKKSEILILKKYFINISNCVSANDIVKYTEEYQKIIATSDLKQDVKNDLNGSLSIAPASSKIWEINNNENAIQKGVH